MNTIYCETKREASRAAWTMLKVAGVKDDDGYYVFKKARRWVCIDKMGASVDCPRDGSLIWCFDNDGVTVWWKNLDEESRIMWWGNKKSNVEVSFMTRREWRKQCLNH